MFKRLIVLAAVVGAASMPVPAAAQNNCGVRDDIVKVLAEKYAESHQASGLQSASSMVEVWASEQTGTWTILVTQPNGVSCIVASGQSWLQYEAALMEGTPS